MKTKLLTDTELRARWLPGQLPVFTVEEGTILTPSARDFIREHGIELRVEKPGSAPSSMTRTPIPVERGKAVFVDYVTGEKLDHKPEEMTHLRGNLLVPKDHPQIEFRGRLDSLMAEIIRLQLLAEEEGLHAVTEDLEEVLGYVRLILGAEVKDEPLEEVRLLGMDSAGLRHASHDVQGTFGMQHPVPRYQMGRMCAELNRLRTLVRETELSAVRAFCAGEACSHGDIIQGLNRLSSCVYIMFCRKISGFYDREE